VEEIADYAEAARERLEMDNAAVTASIMIAQPLLERWAPEWKLAYTIAVAIGTKITTEGFFLSDIIQHLTNEYSLQTLIRCERIALEAYDLLDLRTRQWRFRNALISVALEQPRPGPMRILQHDTKEESHILIVDESTLELRRHRSLVLDLQPKAKVHCCRSVLAAIEYMKECRDRLEQVTLVMIDVSVRQSLLPMVEATPTTQAALEAHAEPAESDAPGAVDGRSFTLQLNELMLHPTIGFGFRPLVAFVTEHAQWLMEQEQMHHDDSIGGADALLCKPVHRDMVRVLVEASSS